MFSATRTYLAREEGALDHSRCTMVLYLDLPSKEKRDAHPLLLRGIFRQGVSCVPLPVSGILSAPRVVKSPPPLARYHPDTPYLTCLTRRAAMGDQ